MISKYLNLIYTKCEFIFEAIMVRREGAYVYMRLSDNP